MKKKYHVLYAVAVLTSAVWVVAWEPCIAPAAGSCPRIRAQENVSSNIEQLQGVWHVQLLSTEPEKTSRCLQVDLHYNQTSHMAYVIASQLTEDGGESRIRSPASVVANTSREELIFGKGGDEDYFVVLGTDYENYTVLHACKTVPQDKHIAYTWLMSRKVTLTDEEDEEFNKSIQTILDNNPFDRKQFKKFNQTNCKPTST